MIKILTRDDGAKAAVEPCIQWPVEQDRVLIIRNLSWLRQKSR